MVLRIAFNIRPLIQQVRLSRSYHISPVRNKLVQFILSDIGEGIREVTVRDWFVKPGDTVSQFDNICLVESDKASVNITSRYDGTVKKLYYSVGDVALVGKPLVDIDTPDGEEHVEKKTEDTIKSEPHTEPRILEESQDLNVTKSLAAPSVRRIAKEHNIQLSKIKGTGKHGRVLKEDILRHLNLLDSTTSASPQKASDSSEIQTGKSIKISGVKKVMFKTMTKANAIPAFGFCDEINMANLMDLRKELKHFNKKGINITYMPFFIKAMSKALEAYPELNASLDDDLENLIIKPNHNIGVAMDTKVGLIVPNIKNVQKLNIYQIAVELDRLMKTGKEGMLSPADLSGGTFTISNIGSIGGTYAKPIIMPPELGIVALGKIQEKVIFNQRGEVVKGHVLYASWAADHRVIDGATMARFGNKWKNYIENPSALAVGL